MTDARYQTLAEAAFEGVAVVDQTRIIDANDQLAEMLGYDSHDELVGEDIDCFLPAEDLEAVRRQIQDSVDRDVVTLEQQRCIRKDGDQIVAELRGKLLHEEERTVSILVLRDVTARKLAERRLERAYADLEQFTHIVSHDLRSPLRAVDNLSQWIIEDLDDTVPEQTAKHLALLRERVEHMDHLITDLLDYAHASVREVGLSRVDVGAMLDQIIAHTERPEGIDIRIEGDMPTLKTAQTPLKQIFINLINNAVQHHDRQQGCITVSARRDGNAYEFCVSDDGPGIAERFHTKIFEVFQALRADGDKRSTGMGLSLVKRLVESAGGSIEVESAAPAQRGTTFCFTWPLHWQAGINRDRRH